MAVLQLEEAVPGELEWVCSSPWGDRVQVLVVPAECFVVPPLGVVVGPLLVVAEA